jgi:hypothetical protein
VSKAACQDPAPGRTIDFVTRPSIAHHPFPEPASLNRPSGPRVGLCLALAALALCGPVRAHADAAQLAVFESAASIVRRSFFDPRFNEAAFDTIVVYHRAALAGPASRGDLEKEVNGLLSELHYSAARFYRPGQSADYTPAFRWRDTRDGVAVTAVQPGSECERVGLLRGNLLLTPTSEFWGPRNSEMNLRVRGDAGEWSHPVRREGYSAPDPDIGWKIYSGRVGYLCARRLTDPATVDTAMLQLRKCQELILDVRYCRDSDPTVLHLLSFFAGAASTAGMAVNRDGMTRLGARPPLVFPANIAENTGSPWLFHPVMDEKGLVALRVLANTEVQFPGPVVVLADENTRGFAELIPSWFQAQKRGLVVGRPTAGRGGLPAVMEVAAGWTLEVPTIALFHADGRPLQGHGVEPDVYIQWSLTDIRGGGDPDLERGLQQFEADE